VVSERDRERWDAKHAAADESRPPDPFFLRALGGLANLAPGTAIDLAAGSGRQALELARRGWRTLAVDVSPVGLARLVQRAGREGLRLETREQDLETDPLPRGPFDLAVVVDYLDRALLARLHEIVPVGGHLIACTYTVDREGRHPSLAHCLERGELARGIPGFAPLLHEEAGGRAGLLAARRRLASEPRTAAVDERGPAQPSARQ
jgi:SAM-dependent methyltransferase